MQNLFSVLNDYALLFQTTYNMCINLTVENWLTIISLLFIVISGCFIYFQWRKSLKIRRAEFINQIIEKLRFDENMAKIMYIVDYNQNWYDSVTF